MFDQALQDRRRNIVRQISDHPRRGAGGDQVAVIDLQGVGLDKAEIFEAGKHPRQARNQLGVEFDGDDAGAAFDEQAGQCAAPRPDFDDRLALPWRHRINNAAGVMRADEEILSETALGSHKLQSLWGWMWGCGLRIADCGLRIAKTFNLDFAYAVDGYMNPQSAIRNY